MAKTRITPDVELATVEALQVRIRQLEGELKGASAESDLKTLTRRIKALQDRLALGSVDKTAAKASLLKSKSDLM